MKKIYVFIFIFVLLSLASVSAWTNTTFNNSLSSELLIFTAYQNITRYLSVPNSISLLINGSMDITGYANYDSSNLVSSWDFNENTSSLARDNVMGKNNGTWVGTPTWKTGKFGSAVNISLGNYINITRLDAQLGNTGNVTYSAWIYTSNCTGSSPDGYPPIIYQASTTASAFTGMHMGLYSTTCKLGTIINDAGNHNYSNNAIPLNEWVFVAITVSGTNATFYINGGQNGSGTKNAWTNPSYVQIGHSTGIYTFNGLIDEVNIFNRSLSSQEILNLYNSNSNSSFLTIGNNLTSIFPSANGSTPLTIRTSNLASIVNQYLNSTYLVGSNYLIPFKFYSTVAGNLNYSGMSFSNEGFVENSQTYNTTTYETAQESFSINITYDSSYTPSSVTLHYNGVAYAGTHLGNGIFTRSIDIPTTTGVKSFNWEISFSGTKYNSTTKTQTVNPIYLVNCNSTINTPYFNFSIKDEVSLAILNGSIESQFTYWLGSGSKNKTLLFSNLTDNNSNYGFCLSPSFSTLHVSGITEFYKSGYDHRTYLFANETFTNTTTIIPLYLLATAASDVVTFTVIDDYYNSLNGVVIKIYRWNIPTDSYLLVNTLVTGSDGTAGSNLVLNDVYYKYFVYYHGTLYLETVPEKVIATSKTLQIFISEFTDIYSNFDDVTSSLTYDNSTKIFTLIYADSGSKISGACLNVQQVGVTGSNTLVQNCSTSFTDTRTFSISPYGNGTFFATGVASYSSATETVYKLMQSLSVSVGLDEKFLVIGRAGYVISIIFIGTMAMVGVASGSIPLGLVLILSSFVVLYVVGFANFTWNFITAILCLIILIVVSLERRFS